MSKEVVHLYRCDSCGTTTDALETSRDSTKEKNGWIQITVSNLFYSMGDYIGQIHFCTDCANIFRTSYIGIMIYAD